MYFSGEVTSVTLPGTSGSFTVWENHAPLISSLKQGKIMYTTEKTEIELTVDSGFAEVSNGTVTVCIESV